MEPMTLSDFKREVSNWRLTRNKVVFFTIGLAAVLVYEFLARPYYRPYIYKNNINDFHIADTLGNSLGTIATIFGFLFLLGGEKRRDQFLIKTITLSVVIYEISHPLLGKPIDPWDAFATILTGGFCYLMYRLIINEPVKINS